MLLLPPRWKFNDDVCFFDFVTTPISLQATAESAATFGAAAAEKVASKVGEAASAASAGERQHSYIYTHTHACTHQLTPRNLLLTVTSIQELRTLPLAKYLVRLAALLSRR